MAHARAFLTGMSAAQAARFTALADLEDRLKTLLDAARAAHPGLQISDAKFLAHLGEKLAPNADAERALSQIAAADLYLACGCAHANPSALAEFEKLLAPVVRRAALKVRRDEGFASDVEQAVRERLLLPREGEPARIADYAGIGPLASWVRSAAVRTALNFRPSTGKQALDDDAALIEGVEAAEGAAIRKRYGAAFKSAFQAALGSLTAQQRNVLRLHHVEGLPLSDIAPMYRTHKSTVSRWLADARAELLKRTRDDLRQRLGVPRLELDSLMRQVKSQIDLSIVRVLGKDESR